VIGEGKDRKVYQHSNPAWVYKVEKTEGVNLKEYTNYLKLKELGLAKWVAPCWMEENILIMMKCEPLQNMPTMIPAIFTDCKKDNFGTLGGRICLIDYSKLRETPHPKRRVRPCM
jgi:hypothetical protein